MLPIRNHTLATLKGALLAATLLISPAALAQSATTDGAKQLQDALTKTFGSAMFDKGIVSITPQDTAYAVKIDFASATGAAAKEGMTVNISPLTYMATPNSDGTYAVTSDSAFNYSVVSTKPDEPFDMKFTLAGCKSTGTFDPKISAFSAYDTECPAGASLVMHSPTQDVEASYGAISGKMTGAASGAGGTTIAMNATLNDFVEKLSVKDGPDPFEATVTAKSGTTEGKLENIQLGTMLDLVSIAANSGGKDKLISQQDAIKQKVLSALPLWNNLGGKVALTDVSVATPLGEFKLASVEETIGVTGVTKEANYGIGIKYSGLELPDSPTIPSWVEPLVPTEGNIDVKFSGIDLDAMARLAVQQFDATKKPPIPDSAMGQFMMMAIAGQPHVTLSPSKLTSSTGEVSAEGTMTVFPSQQGKVTISATNLDQMVDALSKSDMPDKDNAMMGVALVKGLAKTGPDGKAVWNVEFDAGTKAVSVNGQVLSAGGGDQ